jgi:hypothetical protein
MSDAVVFLCSEDQLDRERKGYLDAFSKRVTTVCVPRATGSDHKSLSDLVSADLRPILFLHPDAWPRWLPKDLVYSPTPTACFSIDTFEHTSRRIQFSKLFDYAFVFHPGYEHRFRAAGHPGAFFLPHAVEAEIFSGKQLERIYEIGWVGRLDGKNYSIRRRYIQELNRRFRLNDIDRYYTPEEMALVYQQSKIVVNLSRDDYLQDANLRCFEAMAGGALLITPNPSELADLGFMEGQHYVSYEHEAQLYLLIQFYLENEAKREEIAQAGQALVMKHHTYDSRVQTILDLLMDSHRPSAPARTWNVADVHATYCNYFADGLQIDTAIQELCKVRYYSRLLAWKLLLVIIKSFIDKIKVLL